MRIAIDASGAAREQGTGVSVYVEELARALAAAAPADEFFLYYRFSRLRDKKLFLEPPGPNFTTVVPPMHVLKARGIDIGHGPDSRLLNLGRAKVVTVHDVFSLVSEEWADKKFRRKKADRYRRIADKADLIICDSKSTMRDFARLHPGTESRLRVVPLGVSNRFHPLSDEECTPVLERLGIRRQYLLHVGNVARRKNLAALIEAFEKVADRHPELLLVLAGRFSYGREDVLEKGRASRFSNRIVFPGYVPREDLPALYSAAEVFVFPSFYEGFGLPAIEACACATPVVASDTSSLPEILAEAAQLVSPSDSDGMAEAVEKMLADESCRDELSRRGVGRAGLFTWERTARETLAVYREALS